MTVTNIWTGRTIPVKVNDPSLSLKDYFTGDKHMALYTEAVCLNCIGTVEESGATEQAMLRMIAKCGINYQEVRK